MAEVLAIRPAIGKKVRRADGQNDALAFPIRVVWNFDETPIPPHFVARGGTVIRGVDLQRVEKHARGVIILVAGRIPLPPGGERFPAEGNDDLFAPFQFVGTEPFFFHPAPVPVKTELPGAI